MADIGSAVAGHRVTVGLSFSASLGLALAASLWWAFFGTGDDDRAGEALADAPPAARPRLALSGYFYAYIPILLGIVGMAAGLKHALRQPGTVLPYGPALALVGGVALFLAGDAAFRGVLRVGPPWYRLAAAALALCCWPAAALLSADAGIALLTAVVTVTLIVERQVGPAIR